MGDLISRSDLYNKLVELETLARNRVIDTPTNSPCYQRYVAQMNERTMFKELVADMPTVYNLENVVEELEKASVGAFDIQTISFRRAVDIVRKGGINERT